MGEALPQRVLGATTVLFGERGGRYPQGNTLHVRGASQQALIDPSLGLLARRDDLPRADWILHSHCHEDHVAGSHLYRDRPWWFHEADVPGIRSIDAFLAIYGYPEPISEAFRPVLTDRFHVTPRDDAQAFADGNVFELGGSVRIRAIHAPGHTRGHCLFHVEPDDVLYLADIDLSSFGPYYGDAWSDLEQFERTLARVRELRARHYATFHHIGVLDDREAFLARLDRFRAVIGEREARLLEYLRAPRSLDEISRHRFVYRPGDDVPFAEAVEVRSMGQHVARLLRERRVREVEPGRYFAG
ncbi:MAG TPA: MBL fold metallo-hydrolase [Myxococcota bacterium]|nr:MBL fold metallo-hydrolase [Myxococcota bacterium]